MSSLFVYILPSSAFLCYIFYMLFHNKLILFNVIIFKYFIFIVNDPSLWIDYCRKDYKVCPECFEGNKSYENWLENIKLISDDFGLNINLIFGRKIHRALWINANGEQKRVIFKYRYREYSENSIEKLRQSILCSKGKNIKNESFTLCSKYSDQFSTTFNHFGNDITFWIYLIYNPELIIIKTIQNSNNLVLKNAIPNAIDYCGFVMIEEDTGLTNLIDYYNHPFMGRIFLAEQLLKTATFFSYGIDGFR